MAFALLMIASAATAQSPADAKAWADSARRAIEVANLAGEPDGIVEARALTERALTRWPNDPWLLHYRGYALYREATMRMGRSGENVEALLDQAEDALAGSARALDLPETHALISSVLGQKIGSSPLKGMTLGPRSNGAMERALEVGPANLRVWLLRGIGAMYTPAMFGGGLDRAEEYLRRAITMIPNDKPAPPAPAWGHDEAWLWLGQVLQKKGKAADARAAYEKALEIQPANNWVRYQLIPSLDKGS